MTTNKQTNKQQSRRFTEWFWVALAFTAKHRDTGELVRHGLQLSTNTVGELESAVWIGGDMHWVSSPLTVTWVNTTSNHSMLLSPGHKKLLPAQDSKYLIASEDGSVRLEYQAWGVVPNSVRTPLVHGSFFHSYGLFSGTVTVTAGAGGDKEGGGGNVISIDRVAGIFEDHSVHW
jgi:hypothetical protein